MGEWKNFEIRSAVEYCGTSSFICSARGPGLFIILLLSVDNIWTRASVGLQDANSHHTALCDAAAANSECPTDPRPQCVDARIALAALSVFLPLVTLTFDLWPPKWEKTCLDSSQTRVQNFTPLSFSAAEKSVTVQTKKNKRITQ